MSDKLQAAQAQLAEVRTQFQIKVYERNLKVLERRLALQESYGEPFAPRYGDWFSIGAPTANADIFLDRSKAIRNVQQLNLAQNGAEDLAETNPNASGICKAMNHYVVGTGATYNLVSADEDQDPPPALCKKLKRFFKKFVKVNKWKDMERDMERRLLVHGEFFLRLFPDEDNVTKVRFVEPQQVIPPVGESSTGDWSWGIQTAPGDTRTPLAYNVRDFRNNEDEIVEAMFIIHVKAGVLSNAKRGIPRFLSTEDELRGSSRVRWASREGEAIRRAITHVRKWPETVGKTEVEAMADAEATDFLAPSALPGPTDARARGYSTETVRTVQLHGPSSIDTNADILDPPSVSFEGAEIVVDQSLQAVAACFQVPEWVVSGKTDVSSYASSLTTESPFTKTIEQDQDVLAGAEVECFERVIEIGIEQGELPADTLEEVEIEVAFPSCVVRNKKEETDRRLALFDKKLVSASTVVSEEGYDPDHEKSKIQEEAPEREALMPTDPNADPDNPETKSGTPGAELQRAT